MGRSSPEFTEHGLFCKWTVNFPLFATNGEKTIFKEKLRSMVKPGYKESNFPISDTH